MEKTAVKTYRDPVLNKIVQEKAVWNRQVSSIINDLIHFKKSMNGWPSKYYKERTRITQPVPIDLHNILNQIAGDFQEIANQGNSILQEQANFSKSHLKRKTDQTLNMLEQTHGPETPKPAVSLEQQLNRGANSYPSLIKLAEEMETKYFLGSEASNPFSRFITRLFNPKFGFGEGARIRRLRMTMLDNCVKTFKALKQLHKEVVKSSKSSIINSHKMMTFVWNYWNIVNRLFSAYKIAKPGDVKDSGGKIEDLESKRENAIEEGRDPDEPELQQSTTPNVSGTPTSEILALIRDYNLSSNYIGSIAKNPHIGVLVSNMERLLAFPKGKKPSQKILDDLRIAYNGAIGATNQELGTQGKSFQQIIEQYQNLPKKEAQLQRYLGKVRHQLIPGATSGPRLEIYKLIAQIKIDLDEVMNLLESGFDVEKLTLAVSQVNRQMTLLRTTVRSLYYSEKPEEASSPFF